MLAPRFRARRSFLLEVDDVPAQVAIWAAANDADNANRLRFIKAVALQMFGECRRQASTSITWPRSSGSRPMLTPASCSSAGSNLSIDPPPGS